MNPFVVDKLRAWRESPLLFVTDAIQVRPSDQQAAALATFTQHKRHTIRSGHGCHAAGTVVLLHGGGCKLVEDVEVGDLLLGDDSTPREVLELYSGSEEMYEITYNSNEKAVVNASHIMSLVCTGSKGKFKTGDVLNIPVKEFVKFPDWLQKRFAARKMAAQYESFPVAIPPYILGLWLGDGWEDRPAFTSIDPEVIIHLDNFAKANGLKMRTSEEDKKSHYISGKENGNIFLDHLNSYDLIRNKHIPAEYLFNSVETRLELLAGLIDSDGWLDQRSKRVFEITQKREGLARDIQFLAQSVGLNATLKRVEKSWTWEGEKKIGLYWTISISRNVEIIPTKIKRKQAPAILNAQRSNLHYGFNLKKLSVDKYYGFELSGNHLYLTSDFFVHHNTGKDAFASWIVLWFLTCFSYPKIMCTAPTARQLNDILWAELSKWTRQSIVADEFVIQSDKIFHKDAPKEWWARAVTASVKASAEDQAETLAGLHAENMLFVCDEASGIPDPVYIPLEGAMTQENNRVLLIGNMTRNTGYFYDSHYDPIQAKLWNRIHWDSRKSTNVSADMIEYFRTKYGEESNTFRIRVCGEPPLNDEMSLIPLHWAQQCVDNDLPEYEDDPRIIGVDVARYGIDSSIILPRVANIIKPWDEYKEMNTNILAQLCKEEFISFEADRLGVDEIGVGGPVLDWLQLNGLRGKAIGVNVANKSFQPEKFYRLRDELWWRVREKCMRAQYCFPSGKLGQTLCDELSSIRFDDGEDGKGIVKIESKKAMKVRNVMSPNIADALCISEFFFTPMAGRVTDRGKVSPPTKKLDRSRVKESSSRYGRYAYQVV